MGRVISDGFVQNAHALGERWRNQRKEKKIRNALVGFEEDPMRVIQEVTQIDREAGFKLLAHQQAQEDRKRTLAEASQKQGLATLKNVALFLREADDDPETDIGAAFDAVAPVLRGNLGVGDEDLTRLRGAFVQNPGLIKALTRNSEGKILQGTPGTQFLDPDTQQVIHTVPQSYSPLQVVRGDGGRDVIIFDKNTGSITNGAPQPGAPTAPAAPVAQASAGPQTGVGARTGGAAPKTVRLNNSGGIKDSPFARSQPGYKGAEGGFAVFETPEAGASAQLALLGNYVKKGFNTPQRIINRWAPVGPENSPESVRNYISHVAGRLGIGPNDPIPEGRLAEAAQAMAEFEAGTTNNLPTTFVGPAPGTRAEPAYSTPGKPEKEPEPGFRQLSPQEVKDRGLNPAVQWQMSGKGEIKMIGPAKQIPNQGKGKQESLGRLGGVNDNLDRLASAASQLASHPGLGGITGIRGVLPNIPGGKAADAQALLVKLKSQVSLNVLQAMRDLSKTGGALGNVSNYEIKTLESNLASLEKAQSYEQFRSELQSIVTYVQKIKARLAQAAKQDGIGGGPSGNTAPNGGPRMPTAKAIARLKSNPTGRERLLFDQAFGKGAAARVLGGK